jgi:hypothetical protein
MIGDYLVWCLVLARMCALARQNARSDRVCLDFSLLRFFVSRQRNEEERQMKENDILILAPVCDRCFLFFKNSFAKNKM